jgi:hypothetical protein
MRLFGGVGTDVKGFGNLDIWIGVFEFVVTSANLSEKLFRLTAFVAWSVTLWLNCSVALSNIFAMLGVVAAG